MGSDPDATNQAQVRGHREGTSHRAAHSGGLEGQQGSRSIEQISIR